MYLGVGSLNGCAWFLQYWCKKKEGQHFKPKPILVHSEMEWTTILILFATLPLVYFYRKGLKPRGMPPGPRGLPWIGNLLCLLKDNKHFHHTAHRLFQQYGGIVGLQFLHQPVVIISDAMLQREAFIKMATTFSNRPTDLPFWKLLVCIVCCLIYIWNPYYIV